jgi:hypothetical protein
MTLALFRIIELTIAILLGTRGRNERRESGNRKPLNHDPQSCWYWQKKNSFSLLVIDQIATA